MFINYYLLLVKINGKKIFVGNDYYKHDYTSIENYNLIVNKIIKEFSIDYYLPHAYSKKTEKIKCKKLDLLNENITLEIIAGYIESCEIYSFGSTVNFSCKQINRNIGTNIFKCLDFSVQPSKINLKNSDKIYTVNKNKIIRLS